MKNPGFLGLLKVGKKITTHTPIEFIGKQQENGFVYGIPQE
jgi:hypothetical protein